MHPFAPPPPPPPPHLLSLYTIPSNATAQCVCVCQ
jgi:hypothetical protein